jgi:zinc protease
MKRTCILLTLTAAVFAQEAPRAQQATDFKGVQLKNKAPVANDILRVKFPRPSESKLANGMEFLVLEEHRSPTIQISISIPTSSMNDPAGVPLSAATGAMMRLGTPTRDARKIAETQAELGISVSFGIGDRTASASVSTLTENLDAALELLSDMLFHPTFPQDELTKWKTQQLTQLVQVRALPDFLATERFADAMYPGGDRRAYVMPSVEGVNRITRETVLEHYNRIFRPEGGRVTVLGDISAKQIAPKLEKLFANWTGAAPKPPELPLVAATKTRRVILVDRPASVQTAFYMGNHAIDRLSPDYFAVQVLNRILGSGPASRLFRNIREEKGYTYGISSGFSASRYSNHFAVQTSVRTEVTGEALREIVREFTDLRDRVVPSDELENAKRALVAAFALSTEIPSTALSNALQIKEYGFAPDYWDTYPEKISAITAADIQRVARLYIPVDNLTVIAVGDASKIRPALEAFGPLEQWDAEGKRLP